MGYPTTRGYSILLYIYINIEERESRNSRAAEKVASLLLLWLLHYYANSHSMTYTVAYGDA